MLRSRRSKWLWLSGAVVALLLFGTQGFRLLIASWREKRDLDRSLVRLRSDNERLTRELNWIQHDPSYTEYLIRKSLGYVKKGEVEYRILKPGKGGGTGKQTEEQRSPGKTGK